MKGKLQEKLSDLRKYVSKLEKYSKYEDLKIKENEEIRATVERYLNLSIEIAVQIGKMIIAHEEYEKAGTYRRVIEVLGENGVIPKEFSQRFGNATGMRHILIHRYGQVDINEVIDALKNDLGDFNTFSKHIAKYAENLEETNGE